MSVRWTLRARLLAILLACCAASALAQDPNATTVQRAAREWLALTDVGEGPRSYDAAGQQFKKAMTSDRWAQALKQARDPFGKVDARTTQSTTFATSFPGAPDGNYAIVLFRTSFAKKADATETVTLEREPDGGWRVVGYFIR